MLSALKARRMLLPFSRYVVPSPASNTDYLLNIDHGCRNIIVNCRISLSKRHYSTKKDPSSTKVVVALSGGVDSAVSAYLLKSQGYDVSGIFMRNWSESDEAYCSGQDDQEQVDRVAHFLGIPYKVVDFQKEYWNHVFEPVLEAYQAGITPNPDVLCNKEIKFKSLTDFVFSRSPEPDFLATGHYAQLKTDPLRPDGVNLCEAIDPNKDQTYFLLQVRQAALRRVMFPIGHLTKPQVREIAARAKLPNAERKESMGLCFVGKRKFDNFIGEYTTRPGSHPGTVTFLESGQVVGVHKGALFYTVGQAANISGAPARMFVVSKDIESNNVVVCQGSHHPALYKDSLRASSINWISGYLPNELMQQGGVLQCQARIRHRQELKSCLVTLHGPVPASSSSSLLLNSTSTINVKFNQPLRAIAEGQYIGLYNDGVCLGGGVITATGPSYYSLQKPVVHRERSSSEHIPSNIPTAEL